MRENLLNELVSEAGVSYLSDLHDAHCFRKVYHALDRLPPDYYSIEEWEEAVSYILGLKRQHFATPASARQFLKAELEKAASPEKV